MSMGRQVMILGLRFAVAAVAIALVDGYVPVGYGQPITAVVLITLGVGLMAGLPGSAAIRGLRARAAVEASSIEPSRVLGLGQVAQAAGEVKSMVG